jgi:ATP-dependent helicase/nuclease subunit A
MRVTAPRTIPDIVLRRQIEASDPAVSAWVSANAGSGKTHVLALRVIRLLLAGIRPEQILCITFTKAAAANMAKRVFDTLAQWTSLDDAALDQAIRSISSIEPGASLRARARRLFALALETPGGLKVQTIHAFCTRLLHQFPFEANVAARFEVLDGAAEAKLLDEVRLSVLLEAAAEPEGMLGRALWIAISTVADRTLKEVIGEAIRNRELIDAWIAQDGSITDAIAGLCSALGVERNDTLDRIDAQTIEGPNLPASEWNSVAQALERGSKQDCEQAARLCAAASAEGEERARLYRGVFMSGEDKPRQRLFTRAIENDDPELADRLRTEQERVLALFERRKAVACRDRTAALIVLATQVIRRYETEKDRRGLLDYDDLIDRTLALLERVESAWVHYKLDLGIDHVLIDEAQDTSPRQWRIVEALTGEFFVGAGARPGTRTIFAVGDEKQSIFSFQGAAPLEFDKMRRSFERLCRGIERELQYIPFRHSFRSGATLLEAVDTVFARPQAYAGLSADNVKTVHEALPDAVPGIVEIWDAIKPDAKREIEAWDAPFDDVTETSPQARLAQKVARNVRLWISQGARAGDILVLVRQRGPLFEAIIRALKDEGVDVAGADRLVLTEHIAVMDLMVLADALLLADDDLALATVLKSPLFGLDDDDLFTIAWQREGSLREALRRKGEAKFVEAAERLDRYAAWARRESPFSFFARVLGPENGRRRFLTRLGPEANDAIDEFLNLALEYEQREAPSLQGFIAWLRTVQADVKRDMEIARDEVRVMTVHGAKGLEAPIVVLADSTTPPAGPPHRQPRLLMMPGPPDRLVWAAAKATDTEPVAAARERTRAEAENEYRRLLYVALTRASERLVVCGYDGERKRPEGCWYDLVLDALKEVAVREPADDGDGELWRYRKAPSPVASAAPPLPEDEADALPPWLSDNAPVEPAALVPLSPSAAHDEAAVVRAFGMGTERRKALARGIHTHRLLQALPALTAEARVEAARRYLRGARELDDSEREAIIAQVQGLLDDARFADLFRPGSRAEVPIVGRIPRGGGTIAVSGQVDRLVVTDKAVLIADYKTNHPAPRRIEDVPPAYIRQLALYRTVLAALFPDLTIKAALVWTDVPDLMEVSAALMDREIAGLVCT